MCRIIEWARAAGVALDHAFYDRAFRTLAIVGNVDQAIGLYKDMVKDGLEGTDETYSTLLQV